MDHIWRRETLWKAEDATDEWHIERQHHQSRCTTCGEIRSVQPGDTRRRYRARRSSNTEHPAIGKLPVKRWLSLDVLIGALHQNRLELLDTLSEWLEAGWIEVEEKLVNQVWQIERVRTSPQEAAERAAQQRAAQDAREQRAVASMTLLLHGWERDYLAALDLHRGEGDLLELLARLHSLLDEQEKALATGKSVSLARTSLIRGGTAHQRWVAILRGILELLAHPRLEYERVFSATWLGDSKAFLKERSALAQFLSIPGGFERIGLVKHTPVVLCWGAWQATIMTYPVDGRAGISFVAVPSDTIAQLQNMRVEANQLLIIENQTPFEMMLRPPHRREKTLYLFGAGFAGHAERALVALWLRAKSDLLWFVWTDWDIGGVNIQRQWFNWAVQEQLPPPQPYRWTRSDLQAWRSVGRALKEGDREELAKMGHPLADLLSECGYTVEQEAMLSIYGG